MESLITSFQTEVQRARVNIGAALDCLASMPDARSDYNAAHWSIMAGVLQRIDYELHALQNSVQRRQGTYPHEVYNNAVGRATVHSVTPEEAAQLDATGVILND